MPLRGDSEFCSASSPEAVADLPNVLIVGETGVGKSSVVNLIAGEQLADVNSGAVGCTLAATPYEIALPGLDRYIRLFDTVGVNEPQLGKTDYLSAIEEANTLICQLLRTGGIRLLLFCIRAGRITSTTQNNHRLFYDILCQKNVSVALVVTGSENEDPMEGWWQKNESVVQQYGLSCDSHACITASLGRDNRNLKEYNDSQKTVRDMLLKHVTRNASWRPEKEGWFIDLAGRLLRWFKGGQAFKKRELARHLHERCHFTKEDAARLTESIWKERQNNAGPGRGSGKPVQTFNVVLFGEVGVGKSSVVNLIAGNDLAATSRNHEICTLTPASYQVVLQSNRLFCIWDTAGLELEVSPDDYVHAVKQACKLIKELERQGGIHLLLLCMHGGRVSESLPRNYQLLVKVLCKEKVPLCIVVTHLENERRMDDWWTKNAKELEKRGICADGHACITTLPGEDDLFRDKYKESRETMRRLLLDPPLTIHQSPKKRFSLPYPRSNQLIGQELEKKLVKECGFSSESAAVIAASIEDVDQLMPSSVGLQSGQP